MPVSNATFRICSYCTCTPLQGTPKYQAILLSLLITALYLSRCIYNIVVVQLSVSAPSYGYGWTNASDLVRIGETER